MNAKSNDRLTLHGMGSPNVLKVILLLEELGLDYDLKHVAVFSQEQFDPAFLQLNPLGKVPVLEDPKLGQPLAESGAIALYLAERAGRLQRRLEGIGAVNPLAKQEYDEEKERLAELTTQREDIERSLAELEKLRSDLTETVERLFEER
jgi:glutathione S-transferase